MQLDPDRGHIRYYGDNKADSGSMHSGPSGNGLYLRTVLFHLGATRRTGFKLLLCCFSRSLIHEGKSKGFWRFLGVGLVSGLSW